MLLLAILLSVNRAAAMPGFKAAEQGMSLPRVAGTWKLSEDPRRIEPKAIFDYMDGGGELYLGYRFRYLDVYDYRDPSDTQILLELYQMRTSDDAFGLLSLDSDGEDVSFGPETAPAGRGVYGAGLLRLWTGDRFVRILAEKETPESRNAVMELARAVTAGRVQGAAPSLLKALPTEFAGHRLNSREVSYFRSHLVLNSLYFLSTQNILKLDLKTEAVMASYSSGAGRSHSIRLLEVRYDAPASAQAAFRSFLQSYLPERKCERAGAGAQAETCLVEDGWIGYRVAGRTLIVAFQLSSEQVARLCLEKATEQLHTWEKSHE